MRETNDLIVRGEISEIDKLVGRIQGDARNGRWQHEADIEKGLRRSGRGRLGVFCYSRRRDEDLPAASLLIYRTGPGELASSSILPAERRSLTDEEANGILADFEANVLRPLLAGLDVEATITSGNSLEWSLSPAAFSRLDRFISMISDPVSLTADDYASWDDFWFQFYSDGSVVDDRDLRDWLKDRGLSDDLASQLIARRDVGLLITHHGLGF